MVRKLTVVMLVGVMCLAGLVPVLAQQAWETIQQYEKVTGKKIEKFNEAPSLAVKVAAGELPPVEKRLPEEPLVVNPWEKIGTYGGTLRLGTVSPSSSVDVGAFRTGGLFRLNLNGKGFFCNVAKSYKFSDDLKTLTITLRKGHKWSDGHPFTVDDVMFVWEDVYLNKELTPVIPARFRPGGKVAEFVKIDDYTFQIKYAVPYPRIIDQFSRGTYSDYGRIYLPKHFLKKYHIKYNPKANELAKKQGYENWTQLFRKFMYQGWGWMEPKMPTLGAFVTESVDTQRKIMVRNPYFHMVDPAGNQLPYIDRIEAIATGDQQVYNMKVVNGEIDFAAFDLLLKDYPLFKRNETKGGYIADLATNLRGAAAAFGPNQTNEDPVLRDIFRDIRFRRALSLGINREEINDLLFFGKGVPRQATILPSVSFYKKEWGEEHPYARYDPEAANRLLDEMGLKWDKNHEYRLRPDGKPLLFTISAPYGEGPRIEIAELVAAYWKDLGIKALVRPMEWGDLRMQVRANKQDMSVFHLDRVAEGFGTRGDPYWQCPYSDQFFVNWPWRMWFMTNGEQGEEPPDSWKEWVKDWDKFFTVRQGTEEYMKLGERIYDFIAEELFAIGTVGMNPVPVVHKKYVRNVPKSKYWGSDCDFLIGYNPEQFFIEK